MASPSNLNRNLERFDALVAIVIIAMARIWVVCLLYTDPSGELAEDAPLMA